MLESPPVPQGIGQCSRRTTGVSSAIGQRATRSDAAYQRSWCCVRRSLSLGYCSGLTKFANLLPHWPSYFAPGIDRIVPGPAQQQAKYAAGVIELVAYAPAKYGEIIVLIVAAVGVSGTTKGERRSGAPE
jgi:hypothetical protein